MVIGFLDRFSDLGIGAAVIQKQTHEIAILETAHTLNTLIALLMFGCALAVAPFTAALFHNSAVPYVVGVLAVNFLFSAIGFLPTTLLTRDLRFATLRTPSVVGSLLRGLTAVVFAWAGFKYWSLVAGTLVGSLTSAVLLNVFRPTRVRWTLHKAIASDLLRFGSPLFFSGLLSFAVFNLDNFFVGSILGTVALGYYTIAWTWSTYTSNLIYDVVHSVLFPRFSQSKLDRTDLASMYCRSVRATMFLGFLGNAALFSGADAFLVCVLGKGSERWLPSLVPLQILCVYGALRAALEPAGNVVMAVGQPKVLIWAQLAPIVVELSFLPIIASRWGLPGVAWLILASYNLQWLVYGRFLRRHIGIGFGGAASLLLPSVLSAVGAVLACRLLPSFALRLDWLSLIVRGVTTCSLFIALHELLSRGAIWTEIKTLLGGRRIPVTSG